MKEFTIGPNDAGQRVDRWLAKTVPLLPAALAQKYIRLKRVKRNGKRTERDARLAVGDTLQLYINDEFFDAPTPENAFLKIASPRLDILYEDDQIMLVNKAPGMVVHADETEQVNTLINHILAYLYQKKEWDPRRENAFAPALCNRIDRNTGGIVIAAKTAEALRVMNQKIRDRELTKRYLCAAVGQLRPASGTLKSWLRRDEKKKQVYVTAKPAPGARTAITKYRTLAVRDGLSLVECDLITGRTHQIRAQLAYAGHPLLGDGKYGQEAVNRRWRRKGQALWSWSLQFQFTTPAGELEYLNGKHWQVSHIDFVEELFPGFDLSRIPPWF
ncbi:MAG: RluA family pseudouridine synthase [Clostridiales bacterium]|nr:RluA family pseudouridine synthase [Clostridiales bacterium]